MTMFELLGWITHNGLALLLGIIGIGLLIGVHEFGHFIMCKLFGIYTPSFSIGFGPTVLAQTFGTTTFTLRAIPLGGYVEIAGLAEPGQGEQKEASRQDQYAFTKKPYYQKLLVLLGGIIFNLAFSIIVFASILYTGAPKTHLLFPYNTTTTIASVAEKTETPLQPGDTITHIEDKRVESGQTLLKTIYRSTKAETPTSITYQRNNTSNTTSLTLDDIVSGNIQLQMTSLQATSLKQALSLSGIITWNIIKQVYFALYRLIAQTKTAGVGGPIMIIAASMQGAQHGISIFLLFLAFLSINLAALNVLPIPVLDGGHVVFLTIETITGRKIPDRIRGYIDYIFALILILFIIITSFFDAWKLFSL